MPYGEQVRFADDAPMVFAGFRAPSRSYRASDLLGTSLSSAPRRRASSNSASTVPVAKITRYGWYVVHLSWLLPRMAKVTQRQRRGLASNGKDPSRPGAGWAHGLVSETHVHHRYLKAKMRGHYAYFGISGNIRRPRRYAYKGERI